MAEFEVVRDDDNERRAGYADAKREIETMGSCPVCHAERYLERTKPARGYMSGWRLAMMGARYELKHECGLAAEIDKENQV